MRICFNGQMPWTLTPIQGTHDAPVNVAPVLASYTLFVQEEVVTEQRLQVQFLRAELQVLFLSATPEHFEVTLAL